jgi:hypothetical protein
VKIGVDSRARTGREGHESPCIADLLVIIRVTRSIGSRPMVRRGSTVRVR